MRPYNGKIEIALGVAEFKRLADLCDAARDACDATWRDYRRKFDAPIIGIFYSMRAWRRYTKAHDAYNEAFARFFAFSQVHIARLQATSCTGMETPSKEMMQ